MNSYFHSAASCVLDENRPTGEASPTEGRSIPIRDSGARLHKR
jgi:hypothetical protein